MSGGSYDYVCFKIQDIHLRYKDECPRRNAFQQLLTLVGDAMHLIEWVDSCDLRRGDEFEAIDACFAFLKEDPQKLIKAAAFDGLKARMKEYFKDLEKE